MIQPIIFNHIPKTGGTTLRIILNRVYGREHVFFIQSKDVKKSFSTLKNLADNDRSNFKVIAGHGANLFSGFVNDPFLITILRDPVALFISQYYYLKESPNSVFLDDVKSLSSIEQYLDYATEKGQDNLLTRYISGSMQWLVDDKLPIPNMKEQGSDLLNRAKKALLIYHAVLDLATFDSGIYALSEKLLWKKIPLYRPGNISDSGKNEIDQSLLKRLTNVLRFDLELYEFFKNNEIDIAEKMNSTGYRYRAFKIRQMGISRAARLLGKKKN